jgi:isopenicillin-N N-acyltransferase-like protein
MPDNEGVGAMTQGGVLSRRGFLAGSASSVLLAAPARVGSPAQYPLIVAQGSHRELGRQHGEQVAAKIHAHLDTIAAGGRMSTQNLRDRALRFRPLFEKYCPHLLEEMQGLAEGAKITLAEGMAVNIRGELGHARTEGCTTYVVSRAGSANRKMLAGQNSDMTPEIPPLGYVLHLKPDHKPEILTWTFGGMIGYHGMNSAGVAHFANALGGGPADRMGMPHYPVKRMMLECDRVDQIVRLFETVPLASNGNYVVCDGHDKILDVEATAAGPEFLEDHGAGFVAHTNHFVCSRYARRENFAQSWKDSFPRLDRMNSLLQGKFGTLSVENLKTFLADHDGYPTSICRHNGESLTVASLISEPGERRMHVAVGNPCQNRYVTYSM